MILLAVGSFYTESDKTFTAVNVNVTCVCCKNSLGSFSNDDGSENVTIKMNSRFIFQTSSRLFQLDLNVKCR